MWWGTLGLICQLRLVWGTWYKLVDVRSSSESMEMILGKSGGGWKGGGVGFLGGVGMEDVGPKGVVGLAGIRNGPS